MILFISGEYPPDVGGVGDYTLRLRLALHERGHATSVLTRRDVKRWDARSLISIMGAAPTRGIVHIQYQPAAFDLLGDICLVPVLMALFRRRVRSVITFHDVRVPYLFPGAGRLRQAAVRLLARSSNAVIAADTRDLELLRTQSKCVLHIPIGSNISRSPPADYERRAFRARLGLQDDDLAIVYFGLLNWSKGVDLLLDAFELVRARTPRARLFVLGGTSGVSDPTDRDTAARLRSRLARAGDALIRPGWLNPVELSAYLLTADVALLPYVDGASARRGSLLACAEHGLPIVSTQPAGAEVTPFIEAEEPDAVRLAEAVARVHASPERLRGASRDLAQQVSWPRIAGLHVDLYNTLLYSRR